MLQTYARDSLGQLRQELVNVTRIVKMLENTFCLGRVALDGQHPD